MSSDHTEEIALILRYQDGECARSESGDSVHNAQELETDNAATRTPFAFQTTADNKTLDDDASTENNNGLLQCDAVSVCRNTRNVVHEQTRTGVHEQAIDTAGFGEFQWRFFVVLALALMADGSEMAKIANVINSAEKAFCMTRAMKTSLGRPP